MALVKVNVDENPAISASFQVQSIPAVFALKDGKVVDAFIGALPEAAVAEFVARLTPAPSEADLLVDEGARRYRGALAPGPRAAARSSWRDRRAGRLLIAGGDTEEAIALLGAHPRDARDQAAAGRGPAGSQQVDVGGVDVEGLLDGLLDRVRDDEAARQEFLDLLETLGPTTPARPTTARRWPPGLF